MRICLTDTIRDFMVVVGFEDFHLATGVVEFKNRDHT